MSEIHPRLPDDVVHEIVDRCQKDKSTLYCLCLVARRFTPICQTRLFSRIDLLLTITRATTYTDVNRNIEQQKRLAGILAENPSLGRLTRDLRLSLFESLHIERQDARNVLPNLARHFDKLEALTLCGDGSFDSWFEDQLNSEGRKAVGTLLQTATLRFLTLKDMNNFPQQLMNGCLQLESVNFDCVSFSEERRSKNPQFLSTTHTHSQMDKLRLAGYSSHFEGYLQSLPRQWNFALTKHLEIYPETIKAHRSAVLSIDGLQPHLSSLSSLRWSVPNQYSILPGLFNKLKLPPSISSFTFDITNVPSRTHRIYAPPVLVDILRGFYQPHPVGHLVLRVSSTWMDQAISVHAEDCLKVLDHTLSLGSFQTLEWEIVVNGDMKPVKVVVLHQADIETRIRAEMEVMDREGRLKVSVI